MNNNDIDYGLNSTGTYLNRIAEYFKAKNKKLWSGTGNAGSTITVIDIDKYSSLFVKIYENDRINGIQLTRQNGYFVGGSLTKNISGELLTSEYVTLYVMGSKVRIDEVEAMHHTSGAIHGKALTGLKIVEIIGAEPIPEKFGLGGVILQLRNLFSPRKAVGIC